MEYPFMGVETRISGVDFMMYASIHFRSDCSYCWRHIGNTQCRNQFENHFPDVLEIFLTITDDSFGHHVMYATQESMQGAQLLTTKQWNDYVVMCLLVGDVSSLLCKHLIQISIKMSVITKGNVSDGLVFDMANQ